MSVALLGCGRNTRQRGPFLPFVGTVKRRDSFLISLPPQQLSLLSPCVAPGSEE